MISKLMLAFSKGLVNGLVEYMEAKTTSYCVLFQPDQIGKLIKEHQIGFDLYDKTKLPDDYLLSGPSLLLFSAAGNVSGGVTFIKDGSKFRTAVLCPVPFRHFPGDMELNGLWIRPNEREVNRFLFWLNVLKFLLSHRMGVEVFFSYETRKKGLSRFYESFMEEQIYEGQVQSIPGMDTAKVYVERVCKCSIRHLAYRTPVLIASRFFRRFGK
jgi:hypothetical protein